MKNISWLNELKIRGGWGKLGSISNINPTNAFTLFGQQVNQSYYDINGTSNSPVAGLYVSQIGNPNTTWEQDILTNVGFDATIIKNKIDLSFDWYKKLISGLLFVPRLLRELMVEPGILLSIQAMFKIQVLIWRSPIMGKSAKDLSLDITGTFTSYNNKVVSLPAGTLYIDQPTTAQTKTSRIQPGHPLGAFFGYQGYRFVPKLG